MSTKPMRWMLSLVCVAFAGISSAAIQSAQLPGLWHFNYKTFAAKAEVVMQLNADQTCSQMGKSSVVGVTKWSLLKCTWRLENNTLLLSVTKSSSPENVGKTTQMPITELSADKLVLASDGKAMEYARSVALSPEFAAKWREFDAQPHQGK